MPPTINNDEETESGRPSKRKRVAEPDRKRVAKACVSCRRLKEKCDGNSPCSRCTRYGRVCGQKSEPVEPATSNEQSQGSDYGRMAYLETIARHFLGPVPLDTDNLKQITQSLSSRDDGLGLQTPPNDSPNKGLQKRFTSNPNADEPTTGLSDSTFTHKLNAEVERRLKESNMEIPNETQCEASHSSTLLSNAVLSIVDLPPEDVSLFLSNVYFDFAQTSVVWVEQDWIDAKLEQLYSSNYELAPHDSPWICSVLTVLAIAVQFAHLARSNIDSTGGQPEMDIDHSASIKFYRLAVQFLPDALLLQCVDSMQAFVLLANLSLTWNEPGLAYQYIGLATTTAAQVDAQSTDSSTGISLKSDGTYDRLCQIAATYERRLSICHGFQLSSGGKRVTIVRQPSVTAVTYHQQISPEVMADLFIQLTDWLGIISDDVSSLTDHQAKDTTPNLQRLIKTSVLYKKWWFEHDISRIPILQLNRHTGPLHIGYHLNLILLGRSLIFSRADSRPLESTVAIYNAVAELIDKAEYSAYEVIDICAMLDRSIGLTRASYIEFNACKSAVLVMLAQSLVGRCHLFRGKLKEGLDLLLSMAAKPTALIPKTSDIKTISSAIEKLAPHEVNQKYKRSLRSSSNVQTGYRSFQNWAKGITPQPSGDLWASNGLMNNTDGLQDLTYGDLLNYANLGFNPVDLME